MNGTRNRPAAVAAIADFIRDHGIVNHSVHGIAKALNTRKGGIGWSFEQRDISEARRLVLAQPLTQPLIPPKENTMEVKKVVGLASGTKPLPIEVKPHLIAQPAPAPPKLAQPPPPAVKPAVEPRLLYAPSGNVAACTSDKLSEAVDELARQEGVDPANIVVYRPVKVRVTRLIDVVEE